MNSYSISALQKIPILLLSLAFLNQYYIAAIQVNNKPPPYYECSSNSTNTNTYTPNSTFHTNLQTLLSWLSSNATPTVQVYNAAVVDNNNNNNNNNTVYGLFMCRFDGEPDCKDCVINNTKVITKLCPMTKEAILWDANCMVRYSNHYFLTTVEESPKITAMNDEDYVGQIGHFNSLLWDTMNEVRNRTVNAPPGSMKYAYKSVNITANQTLYASEYCTPYLSRENCSWCLNDALAEVQTSCCKGKRGGRVIYPSCGLRFELYPFYHAVTSISPTVPLNPLAPPEPGKRKHSKTVIIVVVTVVVLGVLLSLGCGCFVSRGRRKNHGSILKESFGNGVSILESFWFDLGEIEAATSKFAKENMIGKGGFGEVYKGVLSNGQEIAVKRLLGSSGQGAIEFKNEVLAIAQLQHKNLVKLLGFCVDGQEKILIYEYVPNKSLDYFLLDPQKRKQLNWLERHKIIGGIARGILYLHEDSRLKIIHRDLKPSNVLLDSDMNPKISDFGMARIVAADNIEENTHRIVGTFGYMSPEYAMNGHFSVKSDVFSFGVMVLDIISGKRKGSYPDSDISNRVDNIRKYAWTKWIDQTPLELLDPHLEGSYSEHEVIRCIHIGLLCVQEDPNDRPTMAKVVSFLNNPTIDLPIPTQQLFFMHRKMEDFDDSNYESINNMTESQYSPR